MVISAESQTGATSHKNMKKSYLKSHKSYASIFLDTTFSHNIIDKKPLTLLKKEQETLTLRKRPQRAWKKGGKIRLERFSILFSAFSAHSLV